MVELSVKYAKERHQFDQPISHFQAIQFMLSEMATLVFAMESMVYRTAVDYDARRNISTHAAMVKIFCLLPGGKAAKPGSINFIPFPHPEDTRQNCPWLMLNSGLILLMAVRWP
jgi:hypothetical protein